MGLGNMIENIIFFFQGPTSGHERNPSSWVSVICLMFIKRAQNVWLLSQDSGMETICPYFTVYFKDYWPCYCFISWVLVDS